MIWTFPPENPYGHAKKLRYFLRHLSGIHSGVLRRRNEPQIRARVLDFGCGNGTAVTQYLSKMFLDVTGVEFDKDCREYAERTLPNVKFHPLLLSVLDQKFNVIIFADVLEHLESPHDYLSLCGRMLAPGGFILGSIPNGHGLFELENKLYRMPGGRWLSMVFEILLNPWRLFRPKRSTIPYNNASPHIQFWTLEDFFDLVNEAGFFVADWQNGTVLGSPPFTAHILEKSQWLMNMNGYVADHMKPRHVSTWLFKLVKK